MLDAAVLVLVIAGFTHVWCSCRDQYLTRGCDTDLNSWILLLWAVNMEYRRLAW